MPAVRRNAARVVLLLALALAASQPVRADDVSLTDAPTPEDGPRRVLNHVECAVAVGMADLMSYTTLAAAIFTCCRAFIDEPNWLPGGN